MTDLCYMCEKPGTTREHVPPKCIFPEQKDTNGKDYRKGLITVPSCDEHNSAKSRDDEYLMMVLTSYFDNNHAAKGQIKSKIVRAWTKKPGFASAIVKNPRMISLLGENRHAFEVDTERFERSLSWAANGLFLHATGQKVNPQFIVISSPLAQFDGPDASVVNLARAEILAMADEMFGGLPTYGENPEVFWFQTSPVIEGRSIVRMCFFEGFQVVAMSSPTMEA